MSQQAGVLGRNISAPACAFLCACLLAFLNIASYAWVSDDAYITFRVVDNAVNGYGLRWNIDERVQAFTHPLWMLLHIPFYALWRNIFLITIILSACLGAGAAALLMRSAPASYLHKAVLVLLPLVLSKAFRHHIIDGLEAPLTLFLLAWFWHDFIRTPERTYRLLFIASLALLNRLDNVVMLLPPLLWLAFSKPLRQISIARVLIATMPVWGWLAFSLLYYGFFFPNTKYAKLNTGLSTDDYIRQGFYYLQNLAAFDLLGYLLIHAAPLFCTYKLSQAALARQAGNNHIMALMALGIILHIAYVIRVGGDFMAGRFFISPFFMGVFLLYYSLRELHWKWVLLLGAVMVAFGHTRARYDRTHPYTTMHGIYDERHYYASRQALFKSGGFLSNALKGNLTPSRISRVMRARPLETRDVPPGWRLPANFDTYKRVVVTGYIGVFGYSHGPGRVIIDNLALTEPLLARLPADMRIWHIGHFTRHIPKGYIRARKTGDTATMHPALRVYYEKLRLITSGDLFAPERLSTILAFNQGRYNRYRNQYVRNPY